MTPWNFSSRSKHYKKRAVPSFGKRRPYNLVILMVIASNKQATLQGRAASMQYVSGFIITVVTTVAFDAATAQWTTLSIMQLPSSGPTLN